MSCSLTSRVVLRPGPGASQETAPSAEPSFAEHTRGTVPLVARRVVAEYDSGEPPAESPSRTSVTVTPLIDPAHRTPIIVIGPTNRSMTTRTMSQRIQVQPRPDPPDRGHRRQSPWSLNLHHSVSGKTLLNGGKLTSSRGGWRNFCLSDSSQPLHLDRQSFRHRRLRPNPYRSPKPMPERPPRSSSPAPRHSRSGSNRQRQRSGVSATSCTL